MCVRVCVCEPTAMDDFDSADVQVYELKLVPREALNDTVTWQEVLLRFAKDTSFNFMFVGITFIVMWILLFVFAYELESLQRRVNTMQGSILPTAVAQVHANEPDRTPGADKTLSVPLTRPTPPPITTDTHNCKYTHPNT